MGAKLTVTPAEARALEVLDVLCLGRNPKLLYSGGLARDLEGEGSEELKGVALRPEVVELGAQRMLLACMRYLRDTGGRADRTVLRDGQRREGRLWDPGFADGFRLRFTAASYGLWTGLAAQFTALMRPYTTNRRGLSQVSRTSLRKVRQLFSIRGTDTGDWLLFALAGTHLHRLGFAVEIQGELLRRLAQGSPLVDLVTLQGIEGSKKGWNRTRLLEPRGLRVLECVDDMLVQGWLAAVRDALRIGEGPAFVQRFTLMTRILGGYLAALDAAGRTDLARAPMRFVAGLVTDVFSGTVEEERRRALAHQAPRSVAERDASLAAVSGVLELGQRLLELRNRHAAERYGDERYEEACVFIADAREHLDPHAERLLALRHGLAGALR